MVSSPLNKTKIKVIYRSRAYISFHDDSVGSMAKGQISKRWLEKKQNMPNFPKNEYFLPPVSGVKKCLFFGKFGVLCFLVTF